MPFLTGEDRTIFRLAIPALGSLAAGPLYVLTDTAIVGHLGEAPLAGLGLAATVLDGILALCNFLAYATTAHVGRTHAAGRVDAARAVASQSVWLAGSLGCAVMLAGWLLGGPVLNLLGGGGQIPAMANSYFQVAVIGLPFALIALAGQGFLRGLQDMRTPLYYIAGGNALNVVLEVLFIYGFGWGLPGSAAATVLAQAAMGACFIIRLGREAGGFAPPSLASMAPLLRMSRNIFVRTAALYSTFLVIGAVLARVGSASLAAHQVLFQLWIFLALLLDAIAVAGQVLVSRRLGSGDAAGAIASARRMIGWSVLAGGVFAALMLALGGPLPYVFTNELSVIDRVRAAWPIFALMQPLNGAVFALDGILIGAGDSRYLMWSMLASAVLTIPVTLAAYALEWGIEGVWLAIAALILVRLLTIGSRFQSGRWVVIDTP